MTFPLPPREAAVLGEFVRLLDARVIDGAALEPRPDTVGEPSGPLGGPAPSSRKVGAAPEPLFPTEEAV